MNEHSKKKPETRPGPDPEVEAKGAGTEPTPWRRSAALVLLAVAVAGLLALAYSQLRQRETERAYRLLGSAAARLEQRLDGIVGAVMAQPLGTDRFDSYRLATAIGRDVERSFRQPGARPEAGVCIGPGRRDLEIRYDGPSAASSSVASGALWEHLVISRPLDELFDQVLDDLSGFDHTLVVTQDGEILHRRGTEQLRIASLGRMAEGRPGSGGAGAPAPEATATPTPLTAGGHAYLGFLQPVRLQFRGKPEGVNWKDGCAGTDLFLAGLVDSGRFHARAVSLPRSWLAATVACLLLLLLGSPILQSLWHGPKAELQRFDRWSLRFAAAAVVGLSALLAWSWLAYRAIEDTHDAQLETLTREIEDSLGNEIEAAKKLLNRLASVDPLQDMKACLGEDAAGRGETPISDPGPGPGEGAQGTEPEEPGDGPGPSRGTAASEPALYATWRTASWIDGSGQQVLKCVPRNASGHAAEITPFVNVSGRRYFQGIKSPQGPEDPWVLDSITSWTRGEPQATISIPAGGGRPATALAPKLPDVRCAPCARESGDPSSALKAAVIALTFRPLSLMDTGLPAGFRFAIVDRTGRVQFHSDEWRNGQEDFLAEVSDSRELQSRLAAGRPGRLPGYHAYDGGRYRLEIRPLSGTGGEVFHGGVPDGWSLVVLRNQDLLDIVRVELFGLGLIDLLIILLLVVGIDLSASVAWRVLGRASERRTGIGTGSRRRVLGIVTTLWLLAGGSSLAVLFVPHHLLAACAVAAAVTGARVLRRRPEGSPATQDPTWATAGRVAIGATLASLVPWLFVTGAFVNEALGDLSSRLGTLYRVEQDHTEGQSQGTLRALFPGNAVAAGWDEYVAPRFEGPLFPGDSRNGALHRARELLPYFDESIGPALRNVDQGNGQNLRGDLGLRIGQGVGKTFPDRLLRVLGFLLLAAGAPLLFCLAALWPMANGRESAGEAHGSGQDLRLPGWQWVRGAILGAPVALLLIVLFTDEGLVRIAAVHRGAIGAVLVWAASLSTHLWPVAGRHAGQAISSFLGNR